MSIDTTTVTVNERKFNGTATLEVFAENKDLAKRMARNYFKDKHGSRSSKAVAEEHNGITSDGRNCYIVMVADHSSGSLQSSEDYEI